jgi:hypothetical protein
MSHEIEKIAKEYLDIQCLDTQHSDGLDFRTLAVWQVKSALERAYLLGQLKGMDDFALRLLAKKVQV